MLFAFSEGGLIAMDSFKMLDCHGKQAIDLL
jgi:hypothetical protein